MVADIKTISAQWDRQRYSEISRAQLPYWPIPIHLVYGQPGLIIVNYPSNDIEGIITNYLIEMKKMLSEEHAFIYRILCCVYDQQRVTCCYVMALVNRNDSLFRLHRPGCGTRKNIETAAKNLEILYHTHFERLEKVEDLTWKSSKWWIVKKLNNQKLLENSMARNPIVVLLWFLWILFIS